MRHRWFHIASLISVILSVFIMVLWLVTFVASPRISLTQRFHIGVWSGFSGDTLGRLMFFNDAQYGPYRGSIIALSDDKHPPKSVWAWRVSENYGAGREIIFDGKGAIQVTATAADFPGIYYRHFQAPNEPEGLWTLMISLWYPLLLFSIFPVAWILRRWRLRSRPNKLKEPAPAAH